MVMMVVVTTAKSRRRRSRRSRTKMFNFIDGFEQKQRSTRESVEVAGEAAGGTKRDQKKAVKSRTAYSPSITLEFCTPRKRAEAGGTGEKR
eukprot:751279-Hanusia_phi.AAC.2